MRHVFVCVVCAIALLFGIAVAEDASIVESGDCGKYGSNVTWTLDSEGTLTILGQGEMRDYSWYNSPWHKIISSIKTIVIYEGVTTIGNYAFYDSNILCDVAIPDSIVKIGNNAFSDCGNLNNVHITSLDAWLNIAFTNEFSNPLYYDGKLYVNSELITNLVFPEDTIQIKEYAFLGCGSLNSITLPEGMTAISDSAFSHCKNLSSINLPESMTDIGACAFLGCNSLRNVDLPDNISSIGMAAFMGCRCLSSIDLPKNITAINEKTFYGCSNLDSIAIPTGVTTIGDNAFGNCESLTNIDLPNSITNIGDYAFYWCTGLKSIDIPDGVTAIGNSAFSSCNRLDSVLIPDGVISIGNDAFANCINLTNICLPESVTAIGSGAFSGSGLISIDFPNGVTVVEASTFAGCNNLINVKFSDNVISIGESAFYSCASMSGITIPKSVTYIGNYAFKSCPMMRDVMFFGSNSISLGNGVFSTYPTIYCHEFSDVDFWAMEHGYNCIYIDTMDLSNPISISLPQDMQIEVGKTITISAGIFPQTAMSDIRWASSNPFAVSVENGILTTHSVGEATITAICGELSAQMIVTSYAFAETFELSESEIWIASKDTVQLYIRNIQPENATAYFIWYSTDISVLTVNDGVITALKPGDATVIATSNNGIVRECLVHVCYPVDSIELEKNEYHMCMDSTAQIVANVTTRSQSFVNRLVHFTSSDESIVTVDNMGCIHTIASGEATITVSAESGITATCTVIVEPNKHIYIIDPYVPATHVTTGRTEGSHCEVCGEILVAQQIIPVVDVKEIRLPAGVKIIDAESFTGSGVVCIVIPDGCKVIGANAFQNCVNLRFIEIPASVESIDVSAFGGCDDLIIVTSPGSQAESFAGEHNIACVFYG